MIKQLLPQILSKNVEPEFFSKLTHHDWNNLFCFARQHNLHILIYTILKQNKVIIPEKINSEMRTVYFAATAVDFRRKEQLAQIIQLFNDANINHILLKGAALINTVYKNSFCRLMSDIDILVKDTDVLRAYKLLLSNGYLTNTTDYEKLSPGVNQHYPPLYKENNLPVEIHTCLSHKYQANLERIRERSQTLEIKGNPTRVMSPEDLIMHIAMHQLLEHMSQNAWPGLYDINQLIKNNKIDWNILKGLTGHDEYDNSKCLFIALLFCKKLFNAEIPEKMLESIKPDSSGDKYEELFAEFLFTDFSALDNDDFAFALNINHCRKNKSGRFQRIFMSPYKMAAYGTSKYGKGNLTLSNLLYLYLQRTCSLINRSCSIAFRMVTGKQDPEAVRMGKNCLDMEYWFLN